MKKALFFNSIRFLVLIILIHIQPMKASSGHYETNVVDVLLFTVSAQAVNDYLLENSKLSLPMSMIYGVVSWLVGELIEALYKNEFERIKKQPLRDYLGFSMVGNVKIDHQHLLRRAITLIPLYLMLKGRIIHKAIR